MKWVDARKPNRMERKAWRTERTTAGKGADEVIQEGVVPWPSES
jgi:hypothetical protein